MDQSDASKHARALSALGAHKGGKARAASLTKEKRQAIARQAAEMRWSREENQSGVAIPKATKFVGKLDLSGYQISCAVLDNGTRVLVERSMANALASKGSGAYWQRKRKNEEGTLPPSYISAGYLQDYVTDELKKKLEQPIMYINKNGRLTTGVNATVLPEICDVWITAKEKGALNEEQAKTAERAYMLMKGFATVGIIALVDEATGYQEIRDRIALQEILDKYLLDYKAAWAKRFPDEFYKQIFRLNKWRYDPSSVKRPSIIGTMTNDVVYSRLAPGILDQLKARTPKDDKGRRKFRYHQLFTEDIGHPKLQEHLSNVTTLMKASSNMAIFHRLLRIAMPKFGENLQLDIPEE
ncbi:MAG: P63C domain-containing protein [Dehalococcoidales bacterium]|nr:P63C domain-containing protein [Dehalococcoidales bacterium]